MVFDSCLGRSAPLAHLRHLDMSRVRFPGLPKLSFVCHSPRHSNIPHSFRGSFLENAQQSM
jgi:hypothetical protein